MCGIVGFLDKNLDSPTGLPTGRILLTMLQALACRGPDGAGLAMLRSDLDLADDHAWNVRITGVDFETIQVPESLGRIVTSDPPCGGTTRFQFDPKPGVTPGDLEAFLGARRGGCEVLSLGKTLDLVKQVGSPDRLEATFGISQWRGPIVIGHTRMSTESRIDLSHSQPFWAHGVAGLATAHNGHITNYHQLRRHYEQEGVTFYTDNDSEVIGVYLRGRLDRGRTIEQALDDSISDLDGAFNYLVATADGLGLVRDRYGFKPMMMVETGEFVAFATEEIALRKGLGGDFRVEEPRPGHALFYPARALSGSLCSDA